MKLKTFLKTIDENATIAIGTEHGGSYMYFGKPKDELIRRPFEDYIQLRAKRREKSYEELAKLLYNSSDYTEVIGKLSPDEFREKLLRKANRVMLYRRHIMNSNRLINKYKDPLERNIVDTYAKAVDCDLAIIIKGYEKGSFMLKSEYEKVYGNV